MTLRTWLLAAAVTVAVFALASLLALWWLGRAFQIRIESQAAAIRATPAPGALRADLPPLVRAYVARSQVADPGRMRWVRIEQRGEMRLAPDAPWLPFTAVQHFAVAQPGFVWQADVRMAGGLWAGVVDSYVGGVGLLEARLLGAIPIAYSAGPDTVKGELQRFLAELPWVPPALAADPSLTYEPLDAHRVQVSTTAGDVTARVVLRFDDAGDVVEATAPDRPRTVAGRNIPTPFGGAVSGYRVLNGLRVPTHAVVWWDLPEGRFEYWRGDVTKVEWQ